MARQTIICIETYDGKLLTHQVEGPIIFTDARLAAEYVADPARGRLLTMKVITVDPDDPATFDFARFYEPKHTLDQLPEGAQYLCHFLKLPAYQPGDPEVLPAEPPIIAEEPEPATQEPSEAEKSMRKRLQDALDALRIQYDGRWGAARLADLLPAGDPLRLDFELGRE